MDREVCLNARTSFQKLLIVVVQWSETLVKGGQTMTQRLSASLSGGVCVVQVVELVFQILDGSKQVSMEFGGLTGLGNHTGLKLRSLVEKVTWILMFRSGAAEYTSPGSEVPEEISDLCDHL